MAISSKPIHQVLTRYHQDDCLMMSKTALFGHDAIDKGRLITKNCHACPTGSEPSKHAADAWRTAHAQQTAPRWAERGFRGRRR